MTSKQIVDELFRKGKLVTPEALELLISGHKPNYTKDFIITEKNINSVKIIKTYTFKDVVTTDDFIFHFNSKYEKVKQIIISRSGKNFLSLDKLSDNKDDVCVIGIVKNIDRQTDEKAALKIEIEDLTGSATVYMNKQTDTNKTSSISDDVELDDVIAVQGADGGKNIYNAKILFPDVPLKQPTKSYGKLCFISGIGFSEVPSKNIDQAFEEIQNRRVDFLFIIGSTKDTSKLENYISKYCATTHVITIPSEKYPQKPEQFKLENITSLINPTLIEINGIKILLVSEFKLSALRKRQLKQPKVPTEPIVIDEIPDVVACCFPADPQIINYKATSIINTGSFLTTLRPVILDLETRDIEQINLKF